MKAKFITADNSIVAEAMAGSYFNCNTSELVFEPAGSEDGATVTILAIQGTP